MQSKLSALLLKGKNVDEMSDMNKMAVHLEQILAEKEGLEVKTRQSLTDPAIKASDFVILCGCDLGVFSEIFKTLGVIESLEADQGPILLIYEEPGVNVADPLNRILMEYMDAGRVSPKVFDKIVHTTSYRDIIGYIDVYVRKLGTEATA